MPPAHKNKTYAVFLASVLGVIGLHRFYLHGRRDLWAWVYAAATLAYAAIVLVESGRGYLGESVPAFFPLPAFAAWIESLYLGLVPDEVWDKRHNSGSPCTTRSKWPLAVLLVATLFGGYIVLVSCLARVTDLMYTGGSFG
ncbi:MAG TPA: hypothetical protein VEC35_24780 [Noviherbaspirillum sp.]|nr:hypothetical protein [Noviherbaspirillum sp.]